MGITPQDMLNINKKLEQAQEDTTPHTGVAGQDIFVIGDANKTEVVKHDYTALLRYPKTFAEHIPEEAIDRVEGEYVFFHMDFKDVFITPRNDLKIVANIAQLLPFFRKLDEDGSVNARTEEELVALCVEVGDECVDAIYKVVGAVLGIDDNLCSHIKVTSALELITDFIRDYPEIFNESDFF